MDLAFLQGNLLGRAPLVNELPLDVEPLQHRHKDTVNNVDGFNHSAGWQIE